MAKKGHSGRRRRRRRPGRRWRGKKAAKRELIDTGTDKRFVRRGDRGKFKESDHVGKSLSFGPSDKGQDEGESGQGDKGDR